MTRVVILYNEPTLPLGHPDADSEHEIVYTVDETEKVLLASGFEVERLGAHVDPGRIITGLRELDPDVVFNLFEGVPEMSATEAFAAGLLERRFREIAQLARVQPLHRDSGELLQRAGADGGDGAGAHDALQVVSREGRLLPIPVHLSTNLSAVPSGRKRLSGRAANGWKP